MGKHGYNHGDIGWCELSTSDTGAALDFYTKLVGWESKCEPMPGYYAVGVGEEMIGGMKKAEGNGAPGWMPYITVTNLAETLAKLGDLGGSQVGDIMPLPDGGRFAIIKDPQGATTGLAQYAGKPS